MTGDNKCPHLVAGEKCNTQDAVFMHTREVSDYMTVSGLCHQLRSPFLFAGCRKPVKFSLSLPQISADHIFTERRGFTFSVGFLFFSIILLVSSDAIQSCSPAFSFHQNSIFIDFHSGVPGDWFVFEWGFFITKHGGKKRFFLSAIKL